MGGNFGGLKGRGVNPQPQNALGVTPKQLREDRRKDGRRKMGLKMRFLGQGESPWDVGGVPWSPPSPRPQTGRIQGWILGVGLSPYEDPNPKTANPSIPCPTNKNELQLPASPEAHQSRHCLPACFADEMGAELRLPVCLAVQLKPGLGPSRPQLPP